MTYSRSNPSPRYRELLDCYRDMHDQGAKNENIPAEEMFPGKALPHHAGMIRGIIEVLGSKTILDYGSGKGLQYGPQKIPGPNGTTFPDIRSFWDVDSITCYDPGYAPFSKFPKGRFDGVVSTDVMEHCPREDLPWIVEEIFSFAEEFVYLSVACYPAQKTLPNGENAHCTIEPMEWWRDLFERTVVGHPGLRYYVAVETKDPNPVNKDKPVTLRYLTGKCRIQP
ncbi:MAG: class I SAM-dependent methyltransferase [Rhodospirillales bacterium]|nr:class I SAM-dependent methyltransferase [Alphaproteobacteria bacterium]MBL6947670.1 class I SAM-dependent methyltransferase [Rhodospirillales bacterium]